MGFCKDISKRAGNKGDSQGVSERDWLDAFPFSKQEITSNRFKWNHEA